MFESGKNIFAQLVKSNDRVKQRKSFLINIYGHILLANNTLNILCANNIWKKGSRVLDCYSQGIIPTKLYEFIVGTFSAMVRQKKKKLQCHESTWLQNWREVRKETCTLSGVAITSYVS